MYIAWRRTGNEGVLHEDSGGGGVEGGGGKWSGSEARIRISSTRQSFPPLYESASSSGLQWVMFVSTEVLGLDRTKSVLVLLQRIVDDALGSPYLALYVLDQLVARFCVQELVHLALEPGT